MKISMTIPEGSDLELRLLAFNKHERSALIKMALSQWFHSDIIPSQAQLVTQPSKTEKAASTNNQLKKVMGDFAD